MKTVITTPKPYRRLSFAVQKSRSTNDATGRRVNDNAHVQDHTHSHNRSERVRGTVVGECTGSKHDLSDSDNDDQSNWNNQLGDQIRHTPHFIAHLFLRT